MKQFDARIISHGQLRSLRLQASDLDEARRQLQDAQVVSLRPLREFKWPGRGARFALNLFIQELVVLLDAGLVLVESVETLRDKASPGINRQVLGELLESMSRGHSFSRAMQARPAIFPRLLVATAASSEHSGQLAVALRRYHHFEAHLRP